MCALNKYKIVKTTMKDFYQHLSEHENFLRELRHLPDDAEIVTEYLRSATPNQLRFIIRVLRAATIGEFPITKQVEEKICKGKRIRHFQFFFGDLFAKLHRRGPKQIILHLLYYVAKHIPSIVDCLFIPATAVVAAATTAATQDSSSELASCSNSVKGGDQIVGGKRRYSSEIDDNNSEGGLFDDNNSVKSAKRQHLDTSSTETNSLDIQAVISPMHNIQVSNSENNKEEREEGEESAEGGEKSDNY